MWYLFLMVLALPGVVIAQNSPRIPPNPCPRVFSYYYDTDGTIFAEILVPNDETKIFRMEVDTSYIGIFDESSRPRLKLDLVTNKNDLLRARQLTYKLTFTRQDLVPSITRVKYNGIIYCRGPPESYLWERPSAQVINLKRLLHIMWVYKETRLQTFTYFTDSTPTRPPVVQTKPTMPPFIPPRTTAPHYPWVSPIDIRGQDDGPEPLIQAPQNDPECGLSDRTQNLITDGSTTVQNEFPWLVAVYQWKGLNYEFRCTANLVDRNHVVTVGSCLKFYKSNLVKTENIMLVLGKSNLKQWADKKDTVLRMVREVQVSPEYTQYSAHGDVAVLTLSKPVDYSRAIKPICLWNSNNDIRQITGKYGTVAGWGIVDDLHEVQVNAKKLEMPVVSEKICLRANSEFSKLISKKTFCAGERNGKGLCAGDIGSPFMVEMNGRWYLRGMVSQAYVVKNKETYYLYQCSLNEYVVFSDVAMYIGWLLTTLNNS